ncbi:MULTISPECIES: hypothetical protein [Brasilonema]|nr:MULTISPECIES: hypothetical protein [Brasilonema]
MNCTPTTPWYKINDDYLHTFVWNLLITDAQMQVDGAESLLQTNQDEQY